MKSFVPLTLAVCLLVSTLTLTAQERLESPGPIRQAFRLSGSVRLARNGVFVMDQKVADLDQLIEAIAMKDVQQVTSAGRTGGSASWAAAGAAAGIALGLMSTVRIVFSPCGGSCSDEKALIGLSLVGLPVLGGVLGYKAGGHDVERIFYRAP